jgi:transposase-like protein
MPRLHQDERMREELMLDLDEIARRGARRMLAEALEAEVEFYIEAARGERDERGHALVTRNGYAKEREILCGAGAVEVKAPRVNDRRVDADGKQREVQELELATVCASLAEG